MADEVACCGVHFGGGYFVGVSDPDFVCMGVVGGGSSQGAIVGVRQSLEHWARWQQGWQQQQMQRRWLALVPSRLEHPDCYIGRFERPWQ